jgi:CTP synthase (UTP-ammonia lyase)
VSGRDEHGARVVELDAHPFFLATLYVPQAGAEDDRERPHPLTAALVRAAAAVG